MFLNLSISFSNISTFFIRISSALTIADSFVVCHNLFFPWKYVGIGSIVLIVSPFYKYCYLSSVINSSIVTPNAFANALIVKAFAFNKLLIPCSNALIVFSCMPDKVDNSCCVKPFSFSKLLKLIKFLNSFQSFCLPCLSLVFSIPYY